MQHPIKANTRLVSPLARLFYMIFNGGDPRAWAAYHMVPERRGTLWVHCHGLWRRRAANLEFTGVPPELRREAIELMFALARIARSKRRLGADEHFAERFTARGQRFAAIGTLRVTGRNDKQHAGMLRVVDYERPLTDGFPLRLFAAHLAAKADAAKDPKKKENLYRRALGIFPGEYAEMNEGADIDPAEPDLTELQHKCNVSAYFGLAESLRAQNRSGEAVAALADAIARCPGWAGAYREHLLRSGDREDRYFRFWRDADIADIAMRRPLLASAAAAPTQPPLGSAAPTRPLGTAAPSRGFGRRPKDNYADLLNRG